jgi:putative redox protein
MSEVTVKWLEDLRFVGVDSTQHGIVISKSGEDSIGTKPSDLLLLALGSCTAYDVVNILQKKRLELRGLEVIVTGTQDPEPPWAFRSFHVHFVVRGQGLTPKSVEDAIRLSHEKYCGVSATLSFAGPVTTGFEIIET